MALTDLTRISTSGIATGSTIDAPILRKDVSFRGSQVGVNSAIFDSSDDALEFNDNVKLTFGNGGDLSIYHTGGNSIIRDQGAGSLSLQSNGTEIALYNYANSQYMGKFANAAQVELYYAGDPKFRTTSTGAVVTGVLTATSFSGPVVGNANNSSGISTFYDLRVSNNLTVEGTTTTLDTNLTGVDRVEVNANSNSDTAIIGIQSGTADIVNLFDGTTEVVTVTDGGKVGIGSITPQKKLDVAGIVKIYGDSQGHGIRIDADSTGGTHETLLGTPSGDLRLQAGNASYFASQANILLENTSKNIIINAGNDGKVGIGTDNPTSTLEINNASPKIVLRDSDNGADVSIANVGGAAVYSSNTDAVFQTPTKELVRFQSTGNVGIGTDNPGRELTIYSPDSGSTYMNLTNATTGAGSNSGVALGLGGDEVYRIWQYGANNTEFGTDNTQHMTLRSTGQLGIGTDFDPPADAKKLTVICDSVGDGIHIGNKENLYNAASTGYSDIRFTFYDYLTGGYTRGGEAIIRARSRNAYTSSRSADLIFMTSDADGSPSSGEAQERVRITSAGNVGIGTINPQAQLEVYKVGTGVTATSVVRGEKAVFAIMGDATNTGASETDARLVFSSDGDVSPSKILTSPLANHGFEIALLNEEPGAGLRFHDGTANDERLRIDTNGRVGIGSTVPTQTLDVNGTLQVAQSLIFNGTELYPTAGIGTNVGHRLNYRRNAPQSRTNTGSAAQQYYKIGEIVLNGSESAEINIYGTQGYSAGTECAGKTTIIMRATNGNTLAGFWYEETLGNANLSDAVWKYKSGTTYELWIKASTYANIAPFVRCTGNGFTSFNEATGDGSAPAGSTAFSTYHRKTVGAVATIRYNPTDTTFHHNIKMDSGKGINFHNYGTGTDISSNLLDDYEEGSWTPVIKGSSTAGTATYISRSARYVKIGRLVHVYSDVRWSAHDGAGGLEVHGLPYSQVGGYWGHFGINYNAGHSWTIDRQIYGWANIAGDYIRYWQTDSNGGSGNLPLDDVVGEIHFYGHYLTTA